MFIAQTSVWAQVKDSQTDFPQIGKPCPDFVLQNIKYFPMKQASLKDFKGKWLILDFWNKGCSACIASFPKINDEQKKFGDKVQFMMVGQQDKENAIQAIYAKFREHQSLKMPCAFDSTLYLHRFSIWGAPYIIIIDPEGIVRGITDNVDSEDIASFLKGEIPKLQPAYRHDESGPSYDINIPFLVRGNGGNDTDFLYRSILSTWTPSTILTFPAKIFDLLNPGNGIKDINKFEALGVSVQRLYLYAYLGENPINEEDVLAGRYWKSVLIESKDSSLIKGDYKKVSNIFSYSLIVPKSKASKQYMMEVMQRDLQNYFGYNLNIEIRKMPYWSLMASEDAKVKLKSKSQNGAIDVKGQWSIGFTAKNYPIGYLLSGMYYYFSDEPPFINETGIEGNIDIAVDWVGTDLNSVKKALQVNGLQLVKKEKEMKVLVIKDPKSQVSTRTSSIIN